MSKQIRVKVLGLILNDDRLFVAGSYEPAKQKVYYRALGGSVEFGESSLTALKREFQEEIQAELINVRYLGCIESIFTYLNQPHHEMIQLYQADFAERKFYELQEFPFVDGDNPPAIAEWLPCDRFKSGELWLVPEACLDYI